MNYFNRGSSITLAMLFICSFVSSCFASPIFHGQSPESLSFAQKLGIDQQVFYPSATELFAYYSQVDAESLQKVDSNQSRQIHEQIGKLITGVTPREPDAIHLHLDHQHSESGRFDNLYDELQKKAGDLGLLVNMREDSNASPSQYPPIQRTSVLEIMLAEPETMARFINYANEAYHQYLTSEHLDPVGSCLFVHPQYTPDESNPAEQYLFHYRGDIMLSNPLNCGVSHNYAITLRDRLLKMQAE